MTAKPGSIHGRQQHVVDKVLGAGDPDGQGAIADFAEGAVVDDDDRCRWLELHDILYPRLDVTDEVATDEVPRCPAAEVIVNFSGLAVPKSSRNE